MLPPPPTSPLFPYTTLFRSSRLRHDTRHRPHIEDAAGAALDHPREQPVDQVRRAHHIELEKRLELGPRPFIDEPAVRSEEHTSELQSHVNLVCRLLLEKKKR